MLLISTLFYFILWKIDLVMNCFALKKEEGNEVYLLHFIRIGSKETSNLFHCFS
jgi:hypothetical protein